MLYTFIARDENDVSVERGEFVTVLNREDPDWYWVVRSDGQEGFVPSAFVYPAEAIQSTLWTSLACFLFFRVSFFLENNNPIKFSVHNNRSRDSGVW